MFAFEPQISSSMFSMLSISFNDSVSSSFDFSNLVMMSERKQKFALMKTKSVLSILENLKAVVNPVEESWQIVRDHITKSAKLALSAASEEQANALMMNPKLREMGLLIKVMGRHIPHMVVYDLPRDRPEGEVLNTILSQNFADQPEKDIVMKELTLVHKFSITRTTRGKGYWICEVSPAFRRVLLDRIRLYVDFSSC